MESPIKFSLYIYDENDKRVYYSSNFTSKIKLDKGQCLKSEMVQKCSKYLSNSDKGEYKARLNLVHTDRSLLEKVSKNFGLVYSIKLTKPIEIECFDKKDEGRGIQKSKIHFFEKLDFGFVLKLS